MRRAQEGDRDLAVQRVVQACRVYRDGGAGWGELTRALGVELSVLREWRAKHPPEPQLPLRAATAAQLSAPPAPPRAPLLSGVGVLACTGHAQPGGNDFSTEVAMIRNRLEPRFLLIERTMIEIAEIAQCLDTFSPRVLHITAHSIDGAVFLTQDRLAVSVLHIVVTKAILMADWRPSTIVLNFCRSIALVKVLQIISGITVICWPDVVDDGQCCEFTDILYHQLAGGSTLRDGMDSAGITLNRWSGLSLPELFGDATITL